jgi:hypothetical protein
MARYDIVVDSEHRGYVKALINPDHFPYGPTLEDSINYDVMCKELQEINPNQFYTYDGWISVRKYKPFHALQFMPRGRQFYMGRKPHRPRKLKYRLTMTEIYEEFDYLIGEAYIGCLDEDLFFQKEYEGQHEDAVDELKAYTFPNTFLDLNDVGIDEQKFLSELEYYAYTYSHDWELRDGVDKILKFLYRDAEKQWGLQGPRSKQEAEEILSSPYKIIKQPLQPDAEDFFIAPSCIEKFKIMWWRCYNGYIN